MSSVSSDTIRNLALAVYEVVYRDTESFREYNVGPDLAYLLGAILKNTPDRHRLECDNDGGHEGILSVLTNAFPQDHSVWAFVQCDPPVVADFPSPARRSRKTAVTVDFDPVDDALSRCSMIDSKSLEEFLDTMLDEDLDVLAQLPGTPGQVLAAQFTYYVRSSVELTEELKRNKTKSQTLIETIYRLPEVKKRRRNSRSTDHDPAAPDTEATA